MEDILQVIFTIVAGLFWLFGGTLFKKRETDDESSPPASSRRRNQRQEDSQNDSEARQREIRESILRKIEERRQQSRPEPVLVPEPKPHYHERQQTEPQKKVSDPTVYRESAKDETAEAAFSWDASNEYEQKMQKRLQEIEATKRKAEALKTQLRQTTENHFDTDSKKDTTQNISLSVGSVHSALKNARNVRAAFVYGEILGKPVSLRSSSEGGLSVGL